MDLHPGGCEVGGDDGLLLDRGREFLLDLYGMVQNTKEIWISPRFYAKNDFQAHQKN